MKRRRDSSLSETRMIGPSITDLPLPVFAEILLTLPVTSIVMCKSVCKAWYGLISDPRFAKLHSAGVKPCALIRGTSFVQFLRSLYLLEPGDGSGFDSGYCGCETKNQKCEICCFDKEVKFKLKIPLRNPGAMHFVADNSEAEATVCLRTAMKSDNLVQLKSRTAHYHEVKNSCNGFLCMAEPASSGPVCICNPVTGEFINLPPASGPPGATYITFGLGFSPKFYQYKVIKMYTYFEYDDAAGSEYGHVKVVEVHTLGTDSWRRLDVSGSDTPDMDQHSYLNGTLYWTFEKNNQMSLASFDLDDERFHTHSMPSALLHGCSAYLFVEVLEGRLFVYTSHSKTSTIEIWLVNESEGVSLSWTQLFSIDISGLGASHWQSFYRLLCLNDQAFVLFGGRWGEFIYYEQSQGLKLKHPRFQGVGSIFKVLVFTPSFLSLKETITSSGNTNIEVLNIYSGRGKLKLLEETTPLLLRQGPKLDVYPSVCFSF